MIDTGIGYNGDSYLQAGSSRGLMAERNRTRRNTLERRCLPKSFKRMFAGSQKGIFKMLEKVKRSK